MIILNLKYTIMKIAILLLLIACSFVCCIIGIVHNISWLWIFSIIVFIVSIITIVYTGEGYTLEDEEMDY